MPSPRSLSASGRSSSREPRPLRRGSVDLSVRGRTGASESPLAYSSFESSPSRWSADPLHQLSSALGAGPFGEWRLRLEQLPPPQLEQLHQIFTSLDLHGTVSARRVRALMDRLLNFPERLFGLSEQLRRAPPHFAEGGDGQLLLTHQLLELEPQHWGLALRFSRALERVNPPVFSRTCLLGRLVRLAPEQRAALVDQAEWLATQVTAAVRGGVLWSDFLQTSPEVRERAIAAAKSPELGALSAAGRVHLVELACSQPVESLHRTARAVHALERDSGRAAQALATVLEQWGAQPQLHEQIDALHARGEAVPSGFLQLFCAAGDALLALPALREASPHTLDAIAGLFEEVAHDPLLGELSYQLDRGHRGEALVESLRAGAEGIEQCSEVGQKVWTLLRAADREVDLALVRRLEAQLSPSLLEEPGMVEELEAIARQAMTDGELVDRVGRTSRGMYERAFRESLDSLELHGPLGERALATLSGCSSVAVIQALMEEIGELTWQGMRGQALADSIAHLAVAARALVGANGEAGDRENVMRSSRQLTAAHSALQLAERCELPPAGWDRDQLREDALDELSDELTRLSAAPPAWLLRECGGRTLLDNARHVMGMPLLRESGSAADDRSPPLHLNRTYLNTGMGVGDLVAVLLKARQGLSAAEGALMLESLVRNVADCVDPSGFQVCADGVGQRLLGAGQGYFPEIQIDLATPRQIFTLKCEEFDRNLDEAGPRPEQLREFYRATLAEMPQLRDDLIGFLRAQYDWAPRTTLHWS
jgi:hypothetical protein